MDTDTTFMLVYIAFVAAVVVVWLGIAEFLCRKHKSYLQRLNDAKKPHPEKDEEDNSKSSLTTGKDPKRVLWGMAEMMEAIEKAQKLFRNGRGLINARKAEGSIKISYSGNETDPLGSNHEYVVRKLVRRSVVINKGDELLYVLGGCNIPNVIREDEDLKGIKFMHFVFLHRKKSVIKDTDWTIFYLMLPHGERIEDFLIEDEKTSYKTHGMLYKQKEKIREEDRLRFYNCVNFLFENPEKKETFE